MCWFCILPFDYFKNLGKALCQEEDYKNKFTHTIAIAGLDLLIIQKNKM